MSGLFNSLFGAGGGILAVRGTKLCNLPQKNAQATALAATFTMSVLSCVIYLFKGYFRLPDALPYLPFGVIGAASGAFLLKKMPDRILRKIFAVFVLWCGAKMVFG